MMRPLQWVVDLQDLYFGKWLKTRTAFCFSTMLYRIRCHGFSCKAGWTWYSRL
jgi:hypothetical protein